MIFPEVFVLIVFLILLSFLISGGLLIFYVRFGATENERQLRIGLTLYVIGISVIPFFDLLQMRGFFASVFLGNVLAKSSRLFCLSCLSRFFCWITWKFVMTWDCNIEGLFAFGEAGGFVTGCIFCTMVWRRFCKPVWVGNTANPLSINAKFFCQLSRLIRANRSYWSAILIIPACAFGWLGAISKIFW